MEKRLWRTAGYITIALGLYMVYKGTEDNILEAEWEEVIL